MAQPFVGQLGLFGFKFAPRGWALCAGQILAISQNSPLFALIGTQFGGDGKSNFQLPNLQGRVPLGFGQGPGLPFYSMGEQGGEWAVTLTTGEVPAHSHSLNAAGLPPRGHQPGDTPVGALFGENSSSNFYSNALSNTSPLGQNGLSIFGAAQAHNNMMPYVTLNWCIALQGIFPSRG